METGDLIHRLSAECGPVRRLACPWQRTALWLAIAIPYVAVIVLTHSSFKDLTGRMDVRLLIEQAAILATAVTAAIAAFSSVVPGRASRLYLLPLVPLAIWLLSLGDGCMQDWLRNGSKGLDIRSDWICAEAALLVLPIPALTMALMLRQGAALTPRISVALGALAVAAMASFGLRFFHRTDASIMILVWHFGALAAFACTAGLVGRFLIKWRGGAGAQPA